MDQRYALIERCQAGRQDTGCVALGDDTMRIESLDRGVDTLETTRGQVGKSLIGLHQFQIAISLNPKILGDLVQHLAMLTGEADDQFDLVRPALALLDYRCHFNGFRSSSEREKNALPGHKRSWGRVSEISVALVLVAWWSLLTKAIST